MGCDGSQKIFINNNENEILRNGIAFYMQTLRYVFKKLEENKLSYNDKGRPKDRNFIHEFQTARFVTMLSACRQRLH